MNGPTFIDEAPPSPLNGPSVPGRRPSPDRWMDGPRAVFILIFLLFVFISPDQAPRRRFRFQDENLEAERQHDFEVLANSTYGELAQAGLNLTGFHPDDGYQWDLLLAVQGLSRRKVHDATPTYADITGEIRGDFALFDYSSNKPSSVNLTALDPRKEYLTNVWSRNITEHEGEVTISLDDGKMVSGAKQMKATIGLWTKSAPGNGWQVPLRGVHLPGGGVILTSFSSKFQSLAALPQLALDEDSFNKSQHVMEGVLANFWEEKMRGDPDIVAIPSCELVVWLQPSPMPEPQRYLDHIEQELTHPDGAPLGEPPPMAFSAVIFSPDCGYILEADTLFGPKSEAYSRLAGKLMVAFIIALVLQIVILKRQMQRAATPSTRSRIAYQGLVIAALGDGLVLFTMIAMLMLDDFNFLIAAACTFLACIHVAFLEVKFVFDIWTVQVGDPARAEHERQRRAQPPLQRPIQTTAAPIQPTAASDGAAVFPLPAATPRTETSMIVQSDGELDQPPSARASFAAIYSRFYFTLVVLMFFSLWAVSWPRPLRSGYANVLAFAYFSLWWPQIYRNTMRNCRKALAWEYILGSSTLRTLPVLYWYFADRNILSVDTSPTTAYVLLGWIWLQITVMVSQQFLGPRLLVKDSWCPPAYDYHPILQEDDVEAGGMSIGLLASASEAKDKDDKTRKIFDCAICMNEIDVPVVSKGEQARGAAWFEQSMYMVTPCRHIFHAECLEGWMNLRLVCPVCRESLPPL